ncbi:MAG TPA: prepilin-type N-terminal cleavage/methylation domain-containing protein [Chthoniobacteraceae bacterium]|nr:prepilin-type N-terminal cleavage/methylation domain-containing protein [Chthoniobacteraceae bacterium]
MKPTRAFTLMELLVSLAVVALLASLLLAGVNKVRSAAHATRCVTNLKAIGSAMRAFTVENRGYFPPHNTYAFFETSDAERVRKLRWHWMSYLAPYLGSPDYGGPVSPVFECPADPSVRAWPKPRPWVPASPEERSHVFCSYGFNYYHLTSSYSWQKGQQTWPFNTVTIRNPASLILVTDGREPSDDPAAPKDPIVHPFSDSNRPTLRHGGRFNAVFLDGHVAAMPSSAAMKAKPYWQPE